MDKPFAAVDAWPIEELIAAIMFAGTGDPASRSRPSQRARDSASKLLASLGGIDGLGRATTSEVEAHIEGIFGRREPARCARRIVAAIELGRRAACEGPAPSSVLSSADVAAWAIPRLVPLDHEELWLLALDGRSHVRGTRCVARGGLHGMAVRPADPLRLALRAGASSFVLVHNHPSGDPSPSEEDVRFTFQIAAAAAVVGMPLLDHVVVARAGFASVPLPEEGYNRDAPVIASSFRE